MKDILKIIRDFEKLSCKGYVRNRPKHKPTDSKCYLERQISKCMMRADTLNLHVDPVIIEMTGMQHIPISHLSGSDKRKSKDFLSEENLLQVCSMDKGESERVISNESTT